MPKLWSSHVHQAALSGETMSLGVSSVLFEVAGCRHHSSAVAQGTQVWPHLKYGNHHTGTDEATPRTVCCLLAADSMHTTSLVTSCAAQAELPSQNWGFADITAVRVQRAHATSSTHENKRNKRSPLLQPAWLTRGPADHLS